MIENLVRQDVHLYISSAKVVAVAVNIPVYHDLEFMIWRYMSDMKICHDLEIMSSNPRVTDGRVVRAGVSVTCMK